MLLFVVLGLVLAWCVGSVLLACTLGRVLSRSNPGKLGEVVVTREFVTSQSPPFGQAA